MTNMTIGGALLYFLLYGIVFPNYVGNRLDFDRCDRLTCWLISAAPFVAFWFGWFSR